MNSEVVSPPTLEVLPAMISEKPPQPVITTSASSIASPTSSFPKSPLTPQSEESQVSLVRRQLSGVVVQPSRAQPSPAAPTSTQSSAVGISRSGLADRIFPKILEVIVVGKPGEPKVEIDETVTATCREISQAIADLGPKAADQFKVLIAGLKDPENHGLRSQLLSRSLPLEEFVAMKENDLVNPVLRAKFDEETKERMKSRNVQLLLAANAGPGTDLYKCPRCGKRNCAMNQKQTRSGDEPMTVFLTCLECYRVFRR